MHNVNYMFQLVYFYWAYMYNHTYNDITSHEIFIWNNNYFFPNIIYYYFLQRFLKDFLINVKDENDSLYEMYHLIYVYFQIMK